MRKYSLNTLAGCWFLLGVLALSGCVGIDVRADQTILLENMGVEDVLNFQVFYGGARFPREPDDRFKAKGRSQYTLVLPVPSEATVVWTTADGLQHRETVPILPHVKGRSWFEEGDGKIVFEIDNAELRVFLVRKLPQFEEERKRIR